MKRPYRKMNLDERRILATMLQAKATKTKIAEVLGRDRSTIHREIKRNWWHAATPKPKVRTNSEKMGYKPSGKRPGRPPGSRAKKTIVQAAE